MPNNYGIDNIDFLKPIPDENLFSVKLTSSESGSTELPSIRVDVEFAEVVYNFQQQTCVSVTNGTIISFTGGDGRLFDFILAPIVPGLVTTVYIPKGVIKNRVGFKNAESNQFEITFTN